MTAEERGPNRVEPEVGLDPRFGEDGAQPLPWDEALRILERAELSWLSTVTGAGRPHVTPVLTVVVDGTIRFCTGAGEQKARNLVGTPHVAVTTGANALHGGTDLVIEGVARRIVDGVELVRVADAFEAKYGPEWRFEVDGASLRGAAGNRAQAYDVVPRVGFGFAKGPYGQTRWRFPTA